MLAFHVVTLVEEASDDLEEYNFVSVLRIHLQEVVVAFELENKPSHLVARVDRSQDYLTLNWVVEAY